MSRSRYLKTLAALSLSLSPFLCSKLAHSAILPSTPKLFWSTTKMNERWWRNDARPTNPQKEKEKKIHILPFFFFFALAGLWTMLVWCYALLASLASMTSLASLACSACSACSACWACWACWASLADLADWACWACLTDLAHLARWAWYCVTLYGVYRLVNAILLLIRISR